MLRFLNISEKFDNGIYIPLFCNDVYVFLEERDEKKLIIATFEGEVIEVFTYENIIWDKVCCFRKNVFIPVWNSINGKIHFVIYKYDMTSKDNIEVLNIRMDRTFENSFAKDEVVMVLGVRFDFFIVSENFIIYYENKAVYTDLFNDLFDKRTASSVILFDIEEKKHYVINDEGFVENRIAKICSVTINEDRFLIIEQKLASIVDKKVFFNSCNENKRLQLESEIVDQILLLNLKNFIENVKAQTTIIYEVIEKMPFSGALNYIQSFNNKIIYRTEEFESTDFSSNYVIFDYNSKSYLKRAISDKFMAGIYKDKIYFAKPELNEVQEIFSSEKMSLYHEWVINFKNILDEKFILIQEVKDEVINRIYNIHSKELVAEVRGFPYIFSNENVIIFR